MCFIVDAVERGGKSTLAAQCAWYCDRTVNLDRLAFDHLQFKKKVMEAQPRTAVIYDEAFSGFNVRMTINIINITLVQMMAEAGQKNLFIFVVMPSFFELDRYMSLHRSRALLHAYCGDNFQRGFFCFYNTDRKKDLYLKGKKLYDYRQSKPNFYGRFTSWLPFDNEEYKKLKIKAFHSRKDGNKNIEERILNAELTAQQKAKLLGVSERTYFRKLVNKAP
jgi:hypothetical protein